MNFSLHVNMAGFHLDSYIMCYDHTLCISNSMHNISIIHVPYLIVYYTLLCHMTLIVL